MNGLENDIALLERYLEEDLDQQERALVEERLRKEQEFKTLLEQERALISGIRYTSRKKLFQRLKALEDTLPEVTIDEPEGKDEEKWDKAEGTKVVAIKKTRYWVAVAASVAVLLIAGFLYFNQKPATAGEIFLTHFEPYQNMLDATTRGEEVDAASNRKLALLAYDQKYFEQAIGFFEKIPEIERDSGTWLYLGNSYLANGEAGKAIKIFEKVLEDPGIFRKQSQWYLALAHLKANEPEAAIKILTVIKNESGNTYSKRAEKIINSMSR